MKNRFFTKFKIFYFLFCFWLALVFGGYFYVDSLINNTAVSENQESVPYFSYPQDCSLLFSVSGERILLNFCFSKTSVKVYLVDLLPATYTDLKVLSADYTLETDYDTVGFLVDCIGGIELETDGIISRYTGVQVVDLLKYTPLKPTIKKEITKKILAGIGESGFTEENMLYLLKVCKTELTFYDTLEWFDYITQLCKNAQFIE